MPLTKTCTKCNETQEILEFNKHKKMKDGFKNICRACTKEYLRNYYLANPEKRRAAKAASLLKNPVATREWRKKSSAKYRMEYPEKSRAKAAVKREVKAGRWKRVSELKCVICERQASERHHPDLMYKIENDLVVMALCRPCHRAEHDRIKQECAEQIAS